MQSFVWNSQCNTFLMLMSTPSVFLNSLPPSPLPVPMCISTSSQATSQTGEIVRNCHEFQKTGSHFILTFLFGIPPHNSSERDLVKFTAVYFQRGRFKTFLSDHLKCVCCSIIFYNSNTMLTDADIPATILKTSFTFCSDFSTTTIYLQLMKDNPQTT